MLLASVTELLAGIVVDSIDPFHFSQMFYYPKYDVEAALSAQLCK